MPTVDLTPEEESVLAAYRAFKKAEKAHDRARTAEDDKRAERETRKVEMETARENFRILTGRNP